MLKLRHDSKINEDSDLQVKQKHQFPDTFPLRSVVVMKIKNITKGLIVLPTPVIKRRNEARMTRLFFFTSG